MTSIKYYNEKLPRQKTLVTKGRKKKLVIFCCYCRVLTVRRHQDRAISLGVAKKEKYETDFRLSFFFLVVVVLVVAC